MIPTKYTNLTNEELGRKLESTICYSKKGKIYVENLDEVCDLVQETRNRLEELSKFRKVLCITWEVFKKMDEDAPNI